MSKKECLKEVEAKGNCEASSVIVITIAPLPLAISSKHATEASEDSEEQGHNSANHQPVGVPQTGASTEVADMVAGADEEDEFDDPSWRHVKDVTFKFHRYFSDSSVNVHPVR